VPTERRLGGSGTVVVFSALPAPEATAAAGDPEALLWVTRIRRALTDGRFVVHAQPIVDLLTGDVTHHELLIRMRDEDGSMIAPGRFLPAAERFGLIEEIDRWMVGQAAELASRGMAVGLNLSAGSVARGSIAGDLAAAIEATGADPALIMIELTETALLSDERAAQAFAEGVIALGCGLALDDFGTGYGGFTYLKRLPVGFLKIDQEFVSDLAINAASRHVVRAIVSLAHGFGQRTIAEGVEDEATFHLLREMGVDCAQGYFIGRPAPVDQAGAGRAPVAAAERDRALAVEPDALLAGLGL
jgi:EAL domain-containing protein (putative c-di-GMP-specific phosphodiesterase class I)